MREKHERAETLRHVLKEVESAAQPDLPVLAATLYQLGRALEFEGTAEDGGEHFARALALYREIDDRRGEANCLQRLGDAALQQSDYEGAERLYQQALAIWLQIGITPAKLAVHSAWARWPACRPGTPSPSACTKRPCPSSARTGIVWAKPIAKEGLGDVARMRGCYAEAGALYQKAVTIFRQIRNRLGEANCIWSLGDVARMQARYDEAEHLYLRAVPILRQIGNRVGEANCLLSLGEVALRQAHYAEAETLLQQAKRIYRQIGDHLSAANSLQSLGDLAFQQAHSRRGRDALPGRPRPSTV